MQLSDNQKRVKVNRLGQDNDEKYRKNTIPQAYFVVRKAA